MSDGQNENITKAETAVAKAAQGDFARQIAEKVKSAENILVALSRNPSVDEIAAAIGLTMFLDGMQKHVTAVYSGEPPENLAFLQPEATFERDTASLQDFIISLNKEKADHLRYKLEGDFVKVYITPYKTEITENDLTFTKGDYNVDFVIAVNVHSADELDGALRDHGRIMHDASAVDITTGEPGHFGEIEWSDPTASSVSEMAAGLIFEIQGNDKKLDAEVATALLTGIVAATERFSNTRTSSDTLSLASKLMAMGADQQLISANVMKPVESVAASESEPPAETPEERAAREREEQRVRAQQEAEAAIARGLPPAPSEASSAAAPDGAAGGMVMSEAPAGASSAGAPLTENGALTGASAGAAASGASEPAANPAAAAAPGVSATNNPEPAMFTIPAMPEGATAPEAAPTAREIAATMPLNTNATVVAPDMGTGAVPTSNSMMNAAYGAAASGASRGISAAAGALANEAPAVKVEEKPVATSAPAMPTKQQQGVTVEPPAPKPEVDYGAMMEQALEEPLDTPVMTQPQMNVISEAEAAAEIEAAKTAAPAPAAPAGPATFAIPGMSAPTSPEMEMTSAPASDVSEPASGSPLPPPPAPDTSSLMPPSI